jgi:regulator of protease activity HflC (stomatin/prohibitin superfamily)
LETVMPQFFEWISRIFGSWKFWIVVPPWDQGVRVRLGKNATRLGPGFHLRVPFVDDVTLVNTRLRIHSTPQVTLQNGSATTAKVICALVGYRIDDPLLAMQRFEKPSIAVIGLAQAKIVAGMSDEENLLSLRDEFAESGIAVEFVRYTDNVAVRTFRLLQTSWGISEDSYPAMQGRY